ncbi:hypothetical protein HAX54_003070, partial [Datura stramonium]|nr:hypothetical protein [Datura stramonium]
SPLFFRLIWRSVDIATASPSEVVTGLIRKEFPERLNLFAGRFFPYIAEDIPDLESEAVAIKDGHTNTQLKPLGT